MIVLAALDTASGSNGTTGCCFTIGSHEHKGRIACGSTGVSGKTADGDRPGWTMAPVPQTEGERPSGQRETGHKKRHRADPNAKSVVGSRGDTSNVQFVSDKWGQAAVGWKPAADAGSVWPRSQNQNRSKKTFLVAFRRQGSEVFGPCLLCVVVWL